MLAEYHSNILPDCMRLYADDTVIYATHQSEDIAHNIVSSELDIVTNWCNSNQLTMNLSKTKMMLFGTRNMLKGAYFNDVTINNTSLLFLLIQSQLFCKKSVLSFL